MNLLKEFSVVKEEIKKILQKSGNDFDFSNEQGIFILFFF